MSGHPNRMLNDTELHNFKLFVAANPHLTTSRQRVEGAFDAMPAGLKRGSGRASGIGLKEFASGGKYDAARYSRSRTRPSRIAGSVMKILGFDEAPGDMTMEDLKAVLATLSNEQKFEVLQCLTGMSDGDDDDDDQAEDDLPESGVENGKPENGVDDPRDAPAMDAKAVAAFDAMYPGMSLPKGDTIGMRAPERLGRVTSKAADSFHAIFPDAVPTKTV